MFQFKHLLQFKYDAKGNKDAEVDIIIAENEENLQFEKPTLGMVFNDKKELQIFYLNLG